METPLNIRKIFNRIIAMVVAIAGFCTIAIIAEVAQTRVDEATQEIR